MRTKKDCVGLTIKTQPFPALKSVNLLVTERSDDGLSIIKALYQQLENIMFDIFLILKNPMLEYESQSHLFNSRSIIYMVYSKLLFFNYQRR